MDLQFTLEQQSLQTLVFHYILNQTSNSKTIIINSILMQLVSNPKYTLINIFDICYRIVEENKTSTSASSRSMTDKEYVKNMGSLLKQICVKYPKLVTGAADEDIVKVVRFAANEVLCAVSGNDYIAFIAMLCNKIKPSINIMHIIQQMLMNKKMHVGSYRQITRLHLYTLLLKILPQKKQNQLDVQYLNKEKDPRNISYVFQIYSMLLNNSSPQNLQVVKKKLFDCLQMYYPIDFEGDADQHNIKLRDIATMLDQCLSHPIFASQLRALLMIKMGAAPIGKYISTFILTRNHPITEPSVTFWINLLKRTSQQQYIQQQYQQDAQYTLSDLIIQLLNRLIPAYNPTPLTSYNAVTQWLHNLIIGKIMDNDDNSKYAPFIITCLKNIMNKCNKQVRHVMAAYVIHNFITYYKNIGDIIYKLGILVPVIQNYCTYMDIQKTGLLILTLSQIFYQPHQQPQPKLIVLKLLMTLGQQPTNYKMITQTNIHITCIGNVRNMLAGRLDDKNIRIVKAYVDFLVELYHGDAAIYQLIVQSKCRQVWVYGLLTLSNKNKQYYQQLGNILTNTKQNKQLVYKQIITNLKLFKPQPILQILSHLPPQIDQIASKQITQIIDQKLVTMDISQQNIQDFVNRYCNHMRMIYYLRNIWRPYLINNSILSYLSQKLTKYISQYPNNIVCQTTIAYYNKSIQALDINLQAQITSNNVTNSQAYKDQTYRMLPIEQDHRYSAQQCTSWPTLLYYAWSSSKQSIRKDLIEYLPNCILNMQANRILPVILPCQDIQTIAKIMNNISQQTLIQIIIPFTINYLTIINDNTQVQKIVSLNKILLDLQAKSKQNQDIHRILVKNKGKILIGIQEKLLQHRKRRARQSSRTIFSIYNAYK